MTDNARLTTEAAELWRRIASRAGFDGSAFRLRLIRARMNEGTPRAVFLLDDGKRRLVMKRLYGDSGAVFANGVTAHNRAAAVFADAPDLHVPTLHLADQAEGVMVMAHAAGQTAHDRLEVAMDAPTRARILQACGRWAGHWHRGTFKRENAVNPEAMVRYMAELGESVAAGDLHVPGRRDFLRCIEETRSIGRAATGGLTRLAATHGDLNTRNLILGPAGVTGLDFGAIHTAPIGHDLARFLINFGNFQFPDGTPGKDRAWWDRDLSAFLDGYGPEGQDDPSLHYLLRTQLMKEWSGIPHRRIDRNRLHQRRWQGTKRLVAFLF